MSGKLDTRAVGLDVGLSFVKWITGAENLHYGLWTGLEVNAGNLRAAQDAYTDKLFELLPKTPVRILDIGGGSGETARKLLALGHTVDIVIPSAFLAERCRVNAPGATVHETKFEDYEGTGPYDLCLFSESFQYIHPLQSLPICDRLLTETGQIIIADCFRSKTYDGPEHRRPVGGGQHITSLYTWLEDQPFAVTSQEDITDAVAPSIDLEQQLFHVFGHAMTRVDDELSAKKPKSRFVLGSILKMALSKRKRLRLTERLTETHRTSDAFREYNCYMMMVLDRKPRPH